MEWQRIETAPNDKPILLAVWVADGPYYVLEVGWWEDCIGGYWAFASEGEPTHWMPLPQPPVSPA